MDDDNNDDRFPLSGMEQWGCNMDKEMNYDSYSPLGMRTQGCWDDTNDGGNDTGQTGGQSYAGSHQHIDSDNFANYPIMGQV